MKITTFNPQIITRNAEALVKLFEELGFEKRHQQEGIGEMDVTGIRMKDSNGFHLDISQPDSLPPGPDLVAIRMNVDNFGEAYNALTACGFKNAQGNKLTGTGSSYGALMVSPSGFGIYLIKHVKQE